MSQTLEDALKNPTPTADKRIRAFTERVRRTPRRQGPATRELPGLNVAALQAKYGADRAHLPRAISATFKVPVGCSTHHLETLKKEAFLRFCGQLMAMGWEPVVDSQHPVQDAPGVYPARDMLDGTLLLDQREWLLRVWFRFKNPQPQRIELAPEDVAPVALTA